VSHSQIAVVDAGGCSMTWHNRSALRQNYAAEKKIRSAVKQFDAKIASRLEWDTEAGT
jgi:hypothetical protein